MGGLCLPWYTGIGEISQLKEMIMTGYWPRHHRFDQALEDVLAKLEREGVDRVDRARVEGIGQRFGLDPTETREAFLGSRGDIWEGEFVETDEKPGWEVVILRRVPGV
jgi:hypothetical protein